MKTFSLSFPIAIGICGILLFSGNNLSANPFIHRDGKLLKDAQEKQISLKGVNLGGWLLWEGWIWGGKLKSQSTIYSGIESTVGSVEAAKFRDDVYKNFINENDIKQISEMGLNVVRVPFNNRIFDTASCHAIGWQVLDSLLKWCGKYHVYAVLDMHAAYGGQNPYFISDPEKTILWKSEDDKLKTISLWKKIAQRYKDNTAVAGYDLLNEPIPSNDQNLLDLYVRIISAIREVDKNHMIILEGSNFAKKFTFFKSLPDENMCFSFHIYTWLGGNPADKIEPYTTLSNQLNAPLWCGEWGENNYDVITQTLNTFAAPGSNVSGWCFWTWKKVHNGYPALNEIVVNEKWKNYITWCSKPDEKTRPTADDAKKVLGEFELAFLSQNIHQDSQLAMLLKNDAMKK
jgi:endoglucanase